MGEFSALLSPHRGSPKNVSIGKSMRLSLGVTPHPRARGTEVTIFCVLIEQIGTVSLL